MSKRIQKCDLKLQTLYEILENNVVPMYQQFLITLYIKQIIPFIYKDCWEEYIKREYIDQNNLGRNYVSIGIQRRGGFTHCTLTILHLSVKYLPGIKILWRCISLRQKAHNVIAVQQMFYDEHIGSVHTYYGALDCIFTSTTRSQIIFIVSECNNQHTGYDLVIYEKIGEHEMTEEILRLCQDNRRVVFVNNDDIFM